MVKRILKSLVVGSIAVFLAALGLDAAENRGNLSESVLGRIFFGSAGSRCEKGMVHVIRADGGFCIDQYEASPSGNCPHPEITGQGDSADNLNSATCRPVSEAGRLPWRYLSQSQAAAACAKAGKRLPNSEEWYLASLGTPDPGGNWGADDCQVDSNWDRQPGPAGAGMNCRSGMGAYDMIGNVWEWNADNLRHGRLGGEELPAEGYIRSVDSQGRPVETDFNEPAESHNRDYLWIKHADVRAVARGGYWSNRSDAGIYAMYLVAPLDFSGAGIGFRCVK